MILWLGIQVSTARGQGSIPGQRAKVPQAVWWGPNNKWKKMGIMLLKKDIISYFSDSSLEM